MNVDTAREAARRPDGKFGVQPRTESPDVSLTGATTAFSAQRRDLSTVRMNSDGTYNVAARDLMVGEYVRNVPGDNSFTTEGTITRIRHSPGAPWIYLDGADEGYQLNHGDAVTCAVEPPDLSDPDVFEAEVERVATSIFEASQGTSDPSAITLGSTFMGMSRDLARERLAAHMQPDNISPDDKYIRGALNGQAHIGEQVELDQRMHGTTTYEVVGKRRVREIVGSSPETGTVWDESHAVEFEIRDTNTGATQWSALTGRGWRRAQA